MVESALKSPALPVALGATTLASFDSTALGSTALTPVVLGLPFVTFLAPVFAAALTTGGSTDVTGSAIVEEKNMVAGAGARVEADTGAAFGAGLGAGAVTGAAFAFGAGTVTGAVLTFGAGLGAGPVTGSGTAFAFGAGLGAGAVTGAAFAFGAWLGAGAVTGAAFAFGAGLGATVLFNSLRNFSISAVSLSISAAMVA